MSRPAASFSCARAWAASDGHPPVKAQSVTSAVKLCDLSARYDDKDIRSELTCGVEHHQDACGCRLSLVHVGFILICAPWITSILVDDGVLLRPSVGGSVRVKVRFMVTAVQWQLHT